MPTFYCVVIGLLKIHIVVSVLLHILLISNDEAADADNTS